MKIKSLIIAVLLTVLAIFIYAFQVEPNLIRTDRVVINNNSTGDDLKIVQISDIHISDKYPVKKLDKIVKKINQENPDIVIFTGDLFDNYAKYPKAYEVTQKLKMIHAKIGKYAVWGNHDYGGGGIRVYPQIMSDSGFTLLRNDGVNISTRDGKRIFIGGMDDSLLGQSSVSETLSYRKKYDYSLVLTHEPDMADELVGKNIQLILAGHSHGGQIHFPFFQINNVLAKKYVRGAYTLNDNTKLYVNTGIGTTHVHARFGVVPEIVSITIKNL